MTSPSSASASSAVTINPGRHTKPDDSERCDLIDMMLGPTFATSEASEEESSARERCAEADIRVLQRGSGLYVRSAQPLAYCPDGQEGRDISLVLR